MNINILQRIPSEELNGRTQTEMCSAENVWQRLRWKVLFQDFFSAATPFYKNMMQPNIYTPYLKLM